MLVCHVLVVIACLSSGSLCLIGVPLGGFPTIVGLEGAGALGPYVAYLWLTKSAYLRLFRGPIGCQLPLISASAFLTTEPNGLKVVVR